MLPLSQHRLSAATLVVSLHRKGRCCILSTNCSRRRMGKDRIQRPLLDDLMRPWHVSHIGRTWCLQDGRNHISSLRCFQVNDFSNPLPQTSAELSPDVTGQIGKPLAAHTHSPEKVHSISGCDMISTLRSGSYRSKDAKSPHSLSPSRRPVHSRAKGALAMLSGFVAEKTTRTASTEIVLVVVL